MYYGTYLPTKVLISKGKTRFAKYIAVPDRVSIRQKKVQCGMICSTQVQEAACRQIRFELYPAVLQATLQR